KKKHDVMEKERHNFIHGSQEDGKVCVGCLANGVPEDVANAIFDEMSSFASYAFNKSHAAAYAVVAYQTAFLKCHYQREFMAALLTSVLDNTDKVIEYTAECQRIAINVLPPNINKSAAGFTVEDHDIRFGLLALKNVGRNLIDTVVRNRAGTPYKSLYDFCQRMHGTEINRRAVESLIKSGAFDLLESSRHAMIDALEGILKSVENDARKNLDGQMDLFGSAAEDVGYRVEPKEEYAYDIMLQLEKEVSGLYLSGHPLRQYREIIDKIGTCTINEITGEGGERYDEQYIVIVCTIVKHKSITTKAGSMMAFLTVEDLSGTMEVILFPKVLLASATAVQDNAVVVVRGRISIKEDEAPKLLAETLVDIKEYEPGKLRVDTKKNKSGLWLKLPSQTSSAYEKVCDLLDIFSGEMPVYLHFEDDKKTVLAPKRLWVATNSTMLKELASVLGEQNVVVK
nr:DNA polymerase III subunit alpha [Oscillospiraceae bacterium]